MNYVALIVGGIVAVILIVAVAYPVIQQTVTNLTAMRTGNENSSLYVNGSERTILTLVPTLVIIGALIAVTVFFLNLNN